MAQKANECLSLKESKYSLDRRRHALQVWMNMEARILMFHHFKVLWYQPIIPQSIPALFLASLAYAGIIYLSLLVPLCSSSLVAILAC